MQENQIHICKKCKTEHFSDEEKNRLPNPEWEGSDLLVCKKCNHDTFYLKFKGDNYTLDNVKLKRGDFYYGVAVVMGTDEHRPTRFSYPKDNGISIINRCYSTYQKCLDACDKINSNYSQTTS